jgi:hypothetical protein
MNNQYQSEPPYTIDNIFNEKINIISLKNLNPTDTDNSLISDIEILDIVPNNVPPIDNIIGNLPNKIQRKRGRKKEKENILNENDRIHTSRERDNLLKKIKTHFHKYIKNFMNSNLASQNINIEFTRFEKSFQNDVTIKTNRMLLDVKMSQILIKIPSCNNQNEKNKIAYLKIKDNERINYLFSMTYVDYYILFLDSKEAKELIKKEKHNDIEKVMFTFINFYRRKKPKIQEKYKNYRTKLFKLLFE